MERFSVDEKLEAELAYSLYDEELSELVPYRRRVRYAYTVQNFIDFLVYLAVSIIPLGAGSGGLALLFWIGFIILHLGWRQYVKRTTRAQQSNPAVPADGAVFTRLYFRIFFAACSMSLIESFVLLPSVIVIFAIFSVIFWWMVPMEPIRRPGLHRIESAFLLNLVDSQFGRFSIILLLALSLVNSFRVMVSNAYLDIGAIGLYIGLLVYYLFIARFFFPFARCTNRWEFFGNLFEILMRIFRQTQRGIVSWVKILAPSLLVTSLLTLISGDLWLMVNHLPIQVLLFFALMLIMFSTIALLMRAGPLTAEEVNRFRSIGSLEVTKSAFESMVSQGIQSLPHSDILEKLESLVKNSQWKLNENLFRRIKSQLAHEYGAQVAISLLVSSIMAILIGYLFFLVFYLVMVPESTVKYWVHSTGTINPASLAWSIDYTAQLRDEASRLVQGFDISVMASEPVPKMSLLSTAIIVSLFLFQISASSGKLLDFLGLTRAKVRVHLALLLAYWWCIEPDFQTIKPTLRFAGLSSKDKGWKDIMSAKFLFVICEKKVPAKHIPLIARQISGTRSGFNFALLMSLSTYLHSPISKSWDRIRFLSFFSDVVSPEERYQLVDRQGRETLEPPDNVFWVWNIGQPSLERFQSLREASEYIKIKKFNLH
jgi:hypothetical protein